MASAKVGTNTVTYLYNALEQRLKKTGPTAIVPTGANYYVYDLQGQLIGEYDATNKVISETVYLGSTPVALIKQTIAGTTTTTTANYIYADQIDTPRVITRASDNKMVWRWDQADPFGLTPASENPQALGVFASNARFPGQVYDKESNLHYNWHRDFDPQLGRYVQSDPIGLAGGINTFAYVGGNPVVGVDPDGLQRAPTNGRFPGLEPITPPGNCTTGECAAGLIRTRPELRPQSEIDRGQCKLVCNMVLTTPVAICNRVLGGGLFGMAVGAGGKAGACRMVCD
jgi:RHS repeat-associated protein